MPVAHGSYRSGPGIRGKLLLAVLTLLLIPWMGYQYVREMKAFVLLEQEGALLLTARAVATVLHDRPELFYTEDDSNITGTDAQTLFAYPLGGVMTLDGRGDDWDAEPDQAQRFTPIPTADVSTLSSTVDAAGLGFTLLMGYRGDYLYALVQVNDDRLVYRDPQYRRLDNSDHLRMTVDHGGSDIRRYIFTAAAAGPMSIYHMDPDWRYPLSGEPVYAAAAQWRETETGYNIELRIPRAWLPPGSGITFAVADVDDNWRRIVENIASTSAAASPAATSRVQLHSPEIAKILKGLDRPAARVTVFDRSQRPRAEAGSLNVSPDEAVVDNSWWDRLLNPLYRYIDGTGRYGNIEAPDSLRSALFARLAAEHNPQTGRSRPVHGGPELLLAMYPVWNGAELAGAVLVEQNSNQSRGTGARLLQNLVSVTLVTFLVVTLALVLFATRLSWRIRRLRDATGAAIGRDGRVRNQQIVPEATTRDELGDLSRSVTDMLGRLAQHTRYLETMPDTLAHEMNNPLNVVSSSLDNLRGAIGHSEGEKYLDRARSGITRLRHILARLTEAANLEDALQSGRRERIDLNELVGGVVEGYHTANPERPIELRLDSSPLPVDVVPDAIVQMLDKLVDNALDFGDPGQPITIQLRREGETVQLEVTDTGAPLPAGMQERIFDPMVSIGKKRASQSRLGLGLYVVRLVTEFHGGGVTAVNLAQGNGVKFTVSLPIAAQQ